MAEHEGGQWNVATKDKSVYLERVSKDDERLFDDSLDPHEARQLARLLTKFADKLDDSGESTSGADEEPEDDDSKESADYDDAEMSKDSDKSEESQDS